MKNLLLITMLLGVGYSQCNEFNWQEYYPDMAGCYLVEANLFLADLSEANLTDANLQGANLEWADLSEANLEGAYLAGAFLEGANLAWANLCNLTGSSHPNFGGGECEESVTDENNDGYDDVSFGAGYGAGATSGDLNLDGIDNVLDVVLLVNQILQN